MMNPVIPLLALIVVFHIRFVCSATHYVMDFPKTDPNLLNTSCLGTPSFCANGWFQAESRRWMLCSQVDNALNHLYYLETGTVKVPEGFLFPVRVHIAVDLNIMKCGGGKTMFCPQKLIMKVYYTTKSRATETAERFELYSARGAHGSYHYQSRFIEDLSGIKSIRLQFSTLQKNFCGAIQQVRVFFYYCSSDTQNLVQYPHFSAETNGTGSCLENSTAPSGTPLTRYCNATGDKEDVGFCVCMQGMTKQENSCQGKQAHFLF